MALQYTCVIVLGAIKVKIPYRQVNSDFPTPYPIELDVIKLFRFIEVNFSNPQVNIYTPNPFYHASRQCIDVCMMYV